MSLYADPETHAANPPKTWEVRKAGERLWQLVDRSGTVLVTATTKREATALLTSGFYFDLWHKEQRWYAGATVEGWKMWEQVKAEREHRDAWLRERNRKR